MSNCLKVCICSLAVRARWSGYIRFRGTLKVVFYHKWFCQKWFWIRSYDLYGEERLSESFKQIHNFSLHFIFLWCLHIIYKCSVNVVCFLRMYMGQSGLLDILCVVQMFTLHSVYPWSTSLIMSASYRWMYRKSVLLDIYCILQNYTLLYICLWYLHCLYIMNRLWLLPDFIGGRGKYSCISEFYPFL